MITEYRVFKMGFRTKDGITWVKRGTMNGMRVRVVIGRQPSYVKGKKLNDFLWCGMVKEQNYGVTGEFPIITKMRHVRDIIKFGINNL